MASNGSSARVESTESSLERIKRQLTSGSGRYLLQGPLLKRSETVWLLGSLVVLEIHVSVPFSALFCSKLEIYDTLMLFLYSSVEIILSSTAQLRKWNERWVILDPTTGKMEYKTRRNEAVMKGTIIFDLNSTITISPVNFHGLQKYDGCCFYIGTPQKKEYFLCAETPGAARAWVSTLHATQLVLRAHREAVNNLTGNGPTKLGTVATVVAAANSTAMEASKEIEAAMKISMRAALGLAANKPNEGHLDDLTIMKVCEERSESCSGADDTLPLTKHVDSSEDDVDKACLSDSRVVPVSADCVVQLAEDGVEIHSIGDAEWSGFRPTDPRIADVREISPQAEGSSLDISVVDPTVDAHQLGVNTHQP
ncbi:hypothetical protein C4D60_Mb05t02130 [Musa balbisiana]|uniref:PH domain-containing protein n=1 Tax=Musa balbisiana TaxID=52838 RepID=A0A4V4H7V4_MUSBA|nr:hypothetical protein C4D60_Mb05t02130 [Musa balbisiana]